MLEVVYGDLVVAGLRRVVTGVTVVDVGLEGAHAVLELVF